MVMRVLILQMLIYLITVEPMCVYYFPYNYCRAFIR